MKKLSLLCATVIISISAFAQGDTMNRMQKNPNQGISSDTAVNRSPHVNPNQGIGNQKKDLDKASPPAQDYDGRGDTSGMKMKKRGEMNDAGQRMNSTQPEKTPAKTVPVQAQPKPRNIEKDKSDKMYLVPDSTVKKN